MAGTIAAFLFSSQPQASADNGVWTESLLGSGLWSDPLNWSGGVVADGSGFTADFSTVDLQADEIVHLDSARTISSLIFGDVTPSHNWFLDDSGTASNTLTLAGTPSITVNNQTATINTVLLGSAGFTKAGAGRLVLSGLGNNYTGATLINSGTVDIAGTGGFGAFQAGGLAGRGTLNITTSGLVSFPGVTIPTNLADGFNSVGGIAGSDGTTGAGAVVQTDGTVNVGMGSGYLEVGADTGIRSTYGSYTLAGGTLTTSGAAGNGSGIRIGAGGFGVFTQTGGTLNVNRFFVAGSGSGLTNSSGGFGVITLAGGSTNISAGTRGIILGDRANCTGILNIGTQAGGDSVLTNLDTNGIRVGSQSDATTLGIVNLNSGTISLNTSSGLRKAGANATGIVNLNGGTLRAGTTTVTLLDTSLNSVNVFRGGVTIDTQANAGTIPAILRVTAGNGLYPAIGTLAIPSNGGGGYIGAPIVTVTSGSGAGSGALAIANVSNGVVTSVTLTNPGQNYAVGDTVNFAFSGGGSTTTANTFSYVLTANDLASNSTGGLTKIGSGTLTLSAANTYTGTTTISNGTLSVTGSISASTSEVSGGILSGTGTTGPVNVNSTGVLAPGVAVGTTLNTGALSLHDNSTLRLDIATLTADQANVTGAVSLDGTIGLELAFAVQPTLNTIFTVVNSSGGINGYNSGARLSYFGNPLDEGEHFIATSGAFTQEFAISYAADGGKDITLQAVPEPGSALALASGAGILLGLGRRRRNAGR